MSTVSGIIDRIESTTRHSKKTGKAFKTYDATLEDGTVLALGFSDQGLKQGDNIECDAEFEYGKMNLVGKPTVNGKGGAMASPTTRTASGGPSKAPQYAGKPFPLPKTHGDTSIVRQNALTNANSAVHNWYTMSGNTPTDSLDDYVEEVIKAAYKMAEFSTGQREARIAKDMGNE